MFFGKERCSRNHLLRFQDFLGGLFGHFLEVVSEPTWILFGRVSRSVQAPLLAPCWNYLSIFWSCVGIVFETFSIWIQAWNSLMLDGFFDRGAVLRQYGWVMSWLVPEPFCSHQTVLSSFWTCKVQIESAGVKGYEQNRMPIAKKQKKQDCDMMSFRGFKIQDRGNAPQFGGGAG